LAARLGGRFPEDEGDLRALPGIGAYTAAAIAAIAFDRPASALDGNGERVIARLFAVKTPLPAAKPELRRLAANLVPASRPGDYAQALMDLGAAICTPVKPKCALCPWRGSCRARIAGIAASLPARAAKKPKPRRFGVAFWAVRPDGAILLRRRPEKGLLGGMMEVPSTSWRSRPWAEKEAVKSAPCRARWMRLPGAVRHGFTHFDLELSILAAVVKGRAKPDGLWVSPGRIKDQALPSLMKKVIAHARNSGLAKL
jgi:A/G-specific adenine glycosylase